ncbi:MAG: copper chaperone PCu(A)C [Pseudonocardiaceae bacterium]
MRRSCPAAALLTTVCAIALALAGCSAGQITQTDSQMAAVDGASGDVGGTIALRDVLIPAPSNSDGSYPARSSVPVLLTIINQGASADELISVTSPAADRVLVLGTRTIPPGMNVTSAIAAIPGTGQPQSPLVAGQLRIVLTTTQPLRTGLNTPVTFVFRNAGTLTVPVPMAAPPDSAGEAVESSGHSTESGGHR